MCQPPTSYGYQRYVKKEETVNESLLSVREQAEDEIAEEDFNQAVADMKVKLRARRWWHALIPFRIVILRRDQ